VTHSLSEPKAQRPEGGSAQVPQARQPSPPVPSPEAAPARASQAKPEPVRAKDLATRIVSRFPDVKVDWMKERRLKVTVPISEIKELALFVRDDLGFEHISAVSGVDWIAHNELEVVYFAGSVKEG